MLTWSVRWHLFGMEFHSPNMKTEGGLSQSYIVTPNNIGHFKEDQNRPKLGPKPLSETSQSSQSQDGD